MVTSVTIMRLFAYLFAWPRNCFGVTRTGMVSQIPPSDTALMVRLARISGSSSLALPEPPQAASAKAATEAVPRARRPECFRIDIVDFSPGCRSASEPVIPAQILEHSGQKGTLAAAKSLASPFYQGRSSSQSRGS